MYNKEKEDILKLLQIITAYEKIGKLCNQELLEAKETIETYKNELAFYKIELEKTRTKLQNLESYNSFNSSKQEDSSNLELEELYFEVELKKGYYSDIFHVMANLELPEKEAEYHWKKISEHAKRMSYKLNREISFTVAMLDYCTHNEILIHNPKIVEFEVFEEVVANSIIDELTGIYNRRFFNTSLFREIKRCSRHERSLSLFVFDLDNFKLFNDNYGHSVGDKALKLVGSLLNKSFRIEDTAARIGGEEFCVILPEINPKDAIIPCERFAHLLKEESAKLLPNTITLSGGIAHYPFDGETPEDLYIAADSYAYFAKKNGKNQIKLTDNL
ncbi:MAG: GGDEF domain-containing protein [Leptospiraceae bacterium]|nr:GGDEF domain-containing protein [Leptospiraceae bacterium]